MAMPRTLGILGFEGRALADDGVTRTAGTGGSYSTVVLPTGSYSTTSFCLDGDASTFVSSWHHGATDTGTPNEPIGTRWTFGMRMRADANDANNNEALFGVSDGTTELIAVSRADTTGVVTLRVSGAVVATSTYTPSTGAFTNYLVDVDNDTAGYVRVYVAGDLSTPIINYTLPAAVASPNAFYFADNGSATHYIDDMWATDMDGEADVQLHRLVNRSVAPVTLTGAGYYTAWENGAGGTGVYSAIDERPSSDADAINTASVDEASTFTTSGVSAPAVHSLKWMARVTREGTTAGESLEFRQRQGGTDADLDTMDAPGDGHCIMVTDTDGAGGEWTVAGLLSNEIGVVSRT